MAELVAIAGGTTHDRPMSAAALETPKPSRANARRVKAWAAFKVASEKRRGAPIDPQVRAEAEAELEALWRGNGKR